MENLLTTLRWDKSSEDIIKETESLIRKSIETYKLLIKLNLSDKNERRKLIQILVNDMTEYTSFHSMCNFLQHITTEKSFNVADKILTEYIIELDYDKHIYNKLYELYSMNNNNLNEAESFFLKKIIDRYIKNGIKLPNKDIQKIKKLKKNITILENKIKNYIEKLSIPITLTQNEIKNLPSNIINYLNPKNNVIIITNNLYNFCMKYIPNGMIRKKIDLAYNSECQNILSKLCNLCTLKNEYAKMLSFNNYSELKLSEQMEKKVDTIRNVIKNFIETTNDQYEDIIKSLLKLKKKI